MSICSLYSDSSIAAQTDLAAIQSYLTPLDFDQVCMSAFPNARDNTPRQDPVTATQFLDAIQNGQYAQVIDQVRELRTAYKAAIGTAGEREAKTAYQQFKAQHLEAITPAGTFHPIRQGPHLKQPSGILIADLDDLDAPEAVKEMLKSDPHVAYAFISPGGDGLKVGVRIAPQSNASEHKAAWFAIADYIGARYGLSLDPSGKDVNRLCCVSDDPHVYRNPGAVPLPLPQSEARLTKGHCEGARPGDALNAAADPAWWRDLLERHGWTFSYQDTNGVDHYTRPGKMEGTSATVGWQPGDGNGQVWQYVWSSNAEPLSPGWHSPFSAYAWLEHGGDFSAAAKALNEQGYGTAPPDDGAQLHLVPSTPTDSPALDLLPALLTLAALRSLDIPERQRFNPWLLACALVMIYGPRGVGKTQLAIGLALSLAIGIAFLTWDTPESVGVLYVDGEMPLDDLRQRVQSQAGDHMPTNLFFLTGEMVYHTLDRDLVLTREECRTAIVQILDTHPEIKVVILDNVSCLFSGISEDRKQDWEPINAWLVRLRHRGLSVILIHHAGKTGQQRGTSGREDALDTVIALDWPPNYDPREGCRFHLRFTKSRSVKGDAVTPLEVKLEDRGDTTGWQAQPLEQSRLKQVSQLVAQGINSVTDIAEELGISKGYASKLKKRAEQGDIGIVL